MAKTRTPRKPALTLIDCLNDPTLRAEIDAIEDIWSSLDHGDRREPTLESLLDHACASFQARTGLNLDPRS